MNKKILSAVLFGALTLASAGSFVSCKDYDDDIKNLQTQIGQLTTSKADVETKLGQLQSALSNAQSAADAAKAAAETAKASAAEALAAAKAADNSAEIAKLEGEIAKLDGEIKSYDAELTKIKDAQVAVDKALAAVQEEIAAQLEEFKKSTQAMIDEAQKKAKETVGEVADYVTSVELLYSTNVGQTVNFISGQVGTSDLVFGKEEKDPKDTKYKADRIVEYKKNSYFSFESASSPIIRVNPSNAVVTKDMLQIVNGKGEDLNIVEIVDVKPYKGNITSRAIETGLWQVVLKLADGVTDAKFNAAKAKDGKTFYYAISVNNTVSAAPTRNVLSDFNLALGTKGSYEKCASLLNVELQSAESMDDPRIISETYDRISRTAKAPIPAKNGEKINISFEEGCTAQYFYVVRDDAYAKNDAVTENELNAWKSYTYTGLNEICEVAKGTDISVTIPENLKTGAEVAFRIFAVNYNGEPVEANGQQFVVYVGKNQTATSVTGNITAAINADGIVEYTTGWLPIEGTLVNGTALPSSATVKFADKSTKDLTVAYAKNAKGEGASENKAIKYVQFSTTDASVFQSWKDNATATGQIVTLDSKELKENVLDVKLTKVLPDAETTKKAMGYSWKDGQLVNGVYTAYLYPTTTYPTIDLVWTASVDYGYKSMNQVINGLKGGAYISVANAARKDDGEKWYYKNALETVGANFDLVVSNAKSSDNVLLIDNTTQRDMSIGYNYGAISSESNDPYKVVVETVKTVFTCPLGTNVQTFAWKQVTWTEGTGDNAVTKKADVNVLTYDNVATVKDVQLAEYIVATNSFDNTVFGKDLKTLKSTYVSGTVKLISNGSKNEDYFKATLTSDFTITLETQSGTTNPAADVPSTLVIELIDAFGHKNVYELPFTVKRAQ